MYLAHYTKRFIPEFDAECRFTVVPHHFSGRRMTERYCDPPPITERDLPNMN